MLKRTKLERTLLRRSFVAGAMATAVAAPKKMRIIDPHVHVWKRDPKYPFAPGQPDPGNDRTPEMLIENMKANGVERTVIIQVRYYMFDNSYARDSFHKYPQYFVAVCRVDPRNPEAPDHLSKLIKEDKFQGMRISPNGTPAGEWFSNAELMLPLWKRCDQLKTPMTVLSPIERIPQAEKWIEKFPDLTVVIDHMADCPVDQPKELEKLLALARYPKVFVKISHSWNLSKQTYPWMDAQEQIKRLYDRFGPKRLMWGTDWPMCEPKTTYGSTLSQVRDEMKFLRDEDKEWMLGKTVERVWKFG